MEQIDIFQQRTKIEKIANKNLPWNELIEELAPYGIIPVAKNSAYPEDFTSQDFVFTELGINRLVGKRSDKITEILRGNGIPEISKAKKIGDDTIVAYSFNKNGTYSHFGLCRQLKSGELQIGSKWGKEGHVYMQKDIGNNGVLNLPLKFGTRFDCYKFDLPF